MSTARRTLSHLRVLRLGTLASALALAAGCAPVDIIDHGITPCSAASCDGCCSRDGRCLRGDTIFACGLGGVSCDVCAPDEVCSASGCTLGYIPDPQSDGGHPATCTAATCDGCCDQGVCVELTAQSGASCGSGGEACGACGVGMYCNGGACETTAACKLVTSVVQVGAVGLLDFGKMPVGGTSTLNVELKNVGSDECKVSAPQWLGGSDTNAFGFGGAPLYPTNIPPGQRVMFPVTFTPYTARTWDGIANAFTFTANDGAPSQCANGNPGCRRVVVRGQGLAAAFTPAAPLLPRTLDFGEVTVGCESAIRTVMLINESSSAVSLQHVSPSSAAFEVLSAVPQTLPAWGSAAIRVRFLPTAPGPVLATMTVTDELEGTRVVDLVGVGVTNPARTEQFTQPSRSFADVLFVVHNGASMAPVQDELSVAVASIVQGAAAQGSAYQFGVITSDAMLANAGLLQGSPKFVTPGTNAAATLANNVRVGSSGSVDQSFEALRLSVVPPNSTDTLRNAGFLRPGARLGVILVSDSVDKSAATVDDYLSALYAATGAAPLGEGVRLYPIVGEAACATGTRLADAVSKVRGFCQTLESGALGPALTAISADLFTGRAQFTLSQPVDSSQPLTVTVDGAPITSSGQYTIDAARNAVVFGSSYVPEPGQTVSVAYSAACHP